MIAKGLSKLMPTRVRNATIENPSMSLNDPKSWEELFQGVESAAGVHVTHRGSLGLGAVWQAAGTISGDMAVMTLNCHRRVGEKDTTIDREHSAHSVVSEQWNDETPAFEGWRRLVLHACLWQNGYAWIDRSGQVGPIKGMYNLLPDRTAPHRDVNGRLYYVTEVNGEPVPLLKEEVFHLKGLSVDPGMGFDLVCAARDTFGLALAAQGFGSKFFANGAMAGGFLEIPAHFTEKAKANLEEGFNKKYTGKDNWFKTVILRDGAKFHAVTIDPQKSQLSQLREDQVREVARFFNLPGYKLGLSDSVSYNSAEQAQLAYLSGCLNHWRTAVTSEAGLKLLTPAERKAHSHYFAHNTSKLIEVDQKTLAEVLEIERRNEVINANEWRRKIDLPPRTDPGGEEYANPNIKSNAATPAESDPETDEANEARAELSRERAAIAARWERLEAREDTFSRECADERSRLAAERTALADDRRAFEAFRAAENERLANMHAALVERELATNEKASAVEAGRRDVEQQRLDVESKAGVLRSEQEAWSAMQSAIREASVASLASGCGIAAQRLCRDAKAKAKDRTVFLRWGHGIAGEYASVLDSHLKDRVTLAAACSGSRRDYMDVRNRFIELFQEQMRAALDSGDDLLSSVERVCADFERDVTPAITNLLLGA